LKWVAFRWRFAEVALVLVILAAAGWRRLEFLTERPFWVDEAESSINALTILDHGVPSDQYLGLPIYENTLVKPWPGNPEYEFKDISYSDRGLAIYHGWLPLYSIAASFALHRVAPDHAKNHAPHRTLEDFKRRSWIARLPSVFFSLVFLALCYWGGISLLGRDAGLTALLVGCFHQTQLDVSTTARYYSATVAVSTAAVLCLWLILTKGQWKHYAIAAGVFTLLFYTHLITFAAGIAVVCTISVYLVWKKRDVLPKVLLFFALLLLMTVPWILATGFLSGLGSIPPARVLLSFPRDLVTFAPARPVYFFCLGAFLAVALCASTHRFPTIDRMLAPLRDCLPAVGLLTLWIACGYASFMLLIPAASFFPERLNLGYWGPALLLGSTFCAGIARMFAKRFALVAAPLLAFLLLAITGHDLRGEPSPDEQGWNVVTGLAAYLDRQEMDPTTRLYASPNDHLNLMFYTGRPFQSIAPVRKSFLNTYRGDILYIERGGFLPRDAALDHSPVNAEVERLSNLGRTLPYIREVNGNILGVPGASGTLLPVQTEAAAVRGPMQRKVNRPDLLLPMFRGYRVTQAHEWRAIFFYRFVDPASREGKHANYAERLRGSQADLLVDSDWAVYHLKFRAAPVVAGVDFRILP
jgi:hypothetical protein